MKTDQEIFWAGDFGNNYVERNLEHSCINNFSKILISNRITINSTLEIGANIGLNLDAIKSIFPKSDTFGIEINEKAFSILTKKHQGWCGSIYEWNSDKQFELTISRGVLIHQNPDLLPAFYSKLYKHSSKYILIDEYFSPYPTEVRYRGHEGKLFKRDFAKEFWDLYPSARLIDYGFFWKHDSFLKSDDSNWFLFEKNTY